MLPPGVFAYRAVGFVGGASPLFFLLALGKILLCSPWSFFFRVGDSFAGCGSSSLLLLPCGGDSARSSSGCCESVVPEDPSPSLLWRSLMVVQRIKSTLDGAPGWWVLQLCQGLGSHDGGVGSSSRRLLSDHCGGVDGHEDDEQDCQGLICFFSFSWGLVCKRVCTMLQINISSLFAKKKRNRTLKGK